MIRPLHLILGAIASTAVIAPALVVAFPPSLPKISAVRAKLPPRRVVSQAELPPVEPVKLVDLSLDDARAYNATIPFVTGPNPPARPFRFVGSIEDRARAVDCLAAGVIYEAGDDTVGQRSVAQVILNRLRHPAFPKTVCGVVFEGQDRSTGCQFTFSCDGAIQRWQPSEAGWKRARDVAEMALSGAVFRPVGYATHYHTDWVVPYWQSSLDKLARVKTHLFFRWTGWWGTPPAFNRDRTGAEPVIEKLAAFSDAHRTAAALAQADAVLAEAAGVTMGAEAIAGAPPGTSPPILVDGDRFVMTLPGTSSPDTWPALAEKTCGERTRCVFTAWRDPTLTPTALPVPQEKMASMTFSYLRDRAFGLERTLWNCTQVPRSTRKECMRNQLPGAVSPATPTSVAAPAIPMDGIRRRSPGTTDAAPAPVTPAKSPATTVIQRRPAAVTPPGTSPPVTP